MLDRSTNTKNFTFWMFSFANWVDNLLATEKSFYSRQLERQPFDCRSEWRRTNARNVGFRNSSRWPTALSTQLTEPNYLIVAHTDAAAQLLKKFTPFSLFDYAVSQSDLVTCTFPLLAHNSCKHSFDFKAKLHVYYQIEHFLAYLNRKVFSCFTMTFTMPRIIFVMYK